MVIVGKVVVENQNNTQVEVVPYMKTITHMRAQAHTKNEHMKTKLYLNLINRSTWESTSVTRSLVDVI